MSTKTYTLTEDAEGHKIRKCSEYVITDEAGKVKAVSLLALDGETPIPLNKNFTAVTSPIVASSYATLISNASSVTDKKITISTESAKMLAEYCKYRGQQTRNLAFGGSFSGNGVDYGGNDSGVAFAYDNGVFTITDNNKNENKSSSPIFKKGKFSLKAGTYVLKALAKKPTTYTINLSDYNTDKWIVDFSNTDVSFTLAEDTDVYVGSYCLPNTTISISENIQVELGTTATDFVPPLTTNTTIADANAKGFKVCTLANGESYELLASLSFDGKTYTDLGLNTTNGCDFEIDYLPSGYAWVLKNDAFEFAIIDGYIPTINTNGKISSYTNVKDYRLISCLENKVFYPKGKNYNSVNLSSYTTESEMNVFIHARKNGDSATFWHTNKITIYSLTFNGNLFVPAKLGETSGLLNLTTNEFKPLQSV